MAIRAIFTGTISFGLVSIPIKFYTSAGSEAVKFNMITPAGHRVKQKYVDAVTGDEAPQDVCLKGFEYAKDQFVTFTADELKKLEADRTNLMEITEFVAAGQLDPLHVEKSYYLGPDKGADKAYALLSQAMEMTGQIAVARWSAKGKEHLVMIRPYRGGLALHIMFYSDEIRDFSEVMEKVATLPVSEQEHKLAKGLIRKLVSASYEPSKYRDTYADRVREAVNQKIAGKEVTVVTPAMSGTVLDLFEALKRSIEEAQEAPAAPAPAPVPAVEPKDSKSKRGKQSKK